MNTKTTTSVSAAELIKQDHRAVEKLYRAYKAAEGNKGERERLAEQICMSLEQHAKMEEKHFYPAVREKAKTKDDLMVAEAYAEHLGMKGLVKTVQNMPEGRARESLMSALMGVVKHHVREEETEMLPKAEKLLGADMMEELGRKMLTLSPSEKQKAAAERMAM